MNQTMIMTNYSFRKEYSCDQFLTVRNWNKSRGKQVKNADIIRYLENIYGKIGEKPKIVKNKRINLRVIVIVKKGVINRFRISSLDTIDICDKLYNPFTDKFEKIKQLSKDLDDCKIGDRIRRKDDYSYEEDHFKNALKRIFSEKCNKNQYAAIYNVEELAKEDRYKVAFVMNPKWENKKIIIDDNTPKIIKKLNNPKYTLKDDFNLLEKYYDKRGDIAAYLADGKYHKVCYFFLSLFSVEKRLELKNKGDKLWNC